MAPNNKEQEEKVPLPLNGDANANIPKVQVTDDMMCGMGSCKPAFLQVFARMGAFTGVYSVCALMTSILNIYIISQITTIEKQFGFSSSQSGFLMSCNDIGFLLTTMIFSYFARKAHIPRTLWGCTVLYGIAGIICSLAFFIAKDLIQEQALHLTQSMSHTSSDLLYNQSIRVVSGFGSTPMCSSTEKSYQTDPNGTATESDCGDTHDNFGVGKPNKFSRAAMGLIALGMIVQGIAKAPRLPFLATYVDDNGKKKDTAMYMGLIAGIGIFGPAIAFALGGVFSRRYVTLEDVPISPRHPAWIGAWWLGFLIFGILSIVIAFPLLLFPRRMKPREAKPQSTDSSFKSGVKDFVKTLMRLISNPVFMPQSTAVCIMLFTVSGMMAFTPKYLETQFFIPAWKANMLLGIITVVSASAGTVTGGFVVTKRKLSPVQCAKLNIVITILALVQTGLGFMLGCTNASIAGQNAENFVPHSNISCATACSCDNNTYFPVCGSDNRNYFSPCHAGCTQPGKMLYSNCSCIPDINGSAKPGLCDETDCIYLYPFLITTVFGSFLGTLAMMPGFIITIRSVSEKDKSMAVGFSALLMTLIGWMAGPIVFGFIVDTACVVWSSSCSGKGACSLYDNDALRIKKHLFELFPKLVVILLYFLVFYNARKKTDWSVDPAEENHKNPETEKMMNGKDAEVAMYPVSWKSDPIYTGTQTKTVS